MTEPNFDLLLDPDLFSHGRLLRRYKGSDTYRFSAKSALNILKNIDTESTGKPQILWDPFCGTGMIPCVGLFAYATKFDRVIASDINREAVFCARNNMRLFCDAHEFDKRLHEVRMQQNGNPGRIKGWGEVARYMEDIRSALPAQRLAPPAIHAFACSAFALPGVPPGQIHFVADLPYGNRSRLQGGTLPNVLSTILQNYPDATATFIMPKKDFQAIDKDRFPGLQWRDLKHGRIVLRLSARH